MTYRVNVLVDWGKAFVDEDGNFYCGTTNEHKENAARIIKTNPDLVLAYSDTHPITSPEFIENGGMYPIHNVVKKDWKSAYERGVDPQKTVSPELTGILQDAIQDRKTGLIAPRHTFFQGFDGEEHIQPVYTLQDVVDTYNVPLLKPKDFLEGNVGYIIQTKHLFDGTESITTDWMGKHVGVPDQEMTATSLLQQQYGLGRDLQFDITGVVTGICVYQTAAGLRRKFPFAEINVIADACKNLTIPALGIPNDEVGDDVAARMLAQIGVNYIKTAEYLKKTL